MPTYEYLCKTCSHRFETVQKMADEPLTVCPECGAYIRRVLFPAGIVFKGSGFYKTDHANGSPANENGSTPKSGGTESTKEGEKKPAASESKPASSGESKSSESSSGASNSKSGENKVAVEAK
jgi:putative FmdB family regulatory protein